MFEKATATKHFRAVAARIARRGRAVAPLLARPSVLLTVLFLALIPVVALAWPGTFTLDCAGPAAPATTFDCLTSCTAVPTDTPPATDVLAAALHFAATH